MDQVQTVNESEGHPVDMDIDICVDSIRECDGNVDSAQCDEQHNGCG